ncbi:MAG: phage holin family protein [Flavobacteriales bacterium]|nr:phage holin family protein [Flavobacteriales bacterium]
MKTLARLLLGTIAVLIADLLLRGVSLGDMDTLDGVLTAVLTATVLALLNSFLKPLLILFTLPITLVSLGLFLLVINAALVMLADSLVPGFTIEAPRFWWALGFSLIVSIVQGMLQGMDKRGEQRGA